MTATLILEIGTHNGEDSVTYRKVSAFPLTLGRGYDNDVILDDPHISPHHARITHNGAGFTLHDDARHDNGTQLNGRPVTASATLRSGDSISMGRTTIRVFDAAHPVPAALPLERMTPALRFITRERMAGAYLLLAMLAVTWMVYQEFWFEKTSAVLAISLPVVCGGVLLWAVPWSVAGRLIRHRAFFAGHISMAALFITASAVLLQIQGYIAFLGNDGRVSVVTQYAFNGILLAALIYGALGLATYLPAMRRLRTAVIFAVCIYGLSAVTSLAGTAPFDPQPQYARTLKPYLSQLARGVTVDEFIGRTDRLFDRVNRAKLSPGEE